MIIKVTNDGQKIVSTNYWETDLARKYCYVSINKGCFRILIPENVPQISLKEMRTGKIVLVTRGKMETGQGEKDCFEFLFEDYTESPYILNLDVKQFDMLPSSSDCDRPGDKPRWKVAVYTKEGKQLELPARYRLAKELPYMQAWDE